MKQKNIFAPLLMLVAVPVVNWLGSLIAATLGLPLFFDSLGTILGVVFGGFWIGAAGGAAYNILSAFMSGAPAASVWALSSVFIALVVWFLLKSKKLKLENFASVFRAGLILAALNSALTTAISFIFWKGVETFPATVVLQNIFSPLLSNKVFNLFIVHLAVEILDKSLIFLVAFGLYKIISPKTLKWKSLILPVAILAVVLTFAAWMSGQSRINSAKMSRDVLIKSQTQQAVSMLETVYKGYKDGMYSFDQAKSLGADLLRNLRYGDQKDGYFWADTSDGTNVVLYGRKDVEGKNRINSFVGGVYHVREIIKNGKKPGGGFTNYFFTRKDGDQPLAKRGYSLYFAPFDWIVGTGYYLDDLK